VGLGGAVHVTDNGVAFLDDAHSNQINADHPVWSARIHHN
jgi:hypothetical protein